MTRQQFFDNYQSTINEILEKYVENESHRISEIMKNGSYTQLNYEKYNIERLSSAKMLLETQKFLQNENK